MQLDAVRLSESLVDLLDDVIKDSDSLKPSLYASLVSAVKHMIPIANAIVEVAPSEIGTSPSSEDSGKSSTMDQNSQRQEQDTLSLPETVVHAQLEGMLRL